MKKILSTALVIAGLSSPAYAYDFLFNGPSGTMVSASYFVSAAELSLAPQTLTPTILVTGSIVIAGGGAPCVLSNTTTNNWVRLVAPGTNCVISTSAP